MLKPLLVNAFVGLRLDALARILKRHKSMILAYHNVVPDDLPLGSIGSQHTRISDFQEQVQWVAAHFEVVPLAEIISSTSASRRNPRAAITFDDAYRGAVLNAVPYLTQHQIPSTMFVAPGCLGSDGFWWDRLQVAGWDNFPLYFEQLRGHQEEVMAWALANGVEARELLPQLTPATEAELTQAVRQAEGCLTVGPHGWHHENFAALSTPELIDALERPLAWLVQRFPEQVVRLLAYPYGLYSAQVKSAAARLGIEAAFVINGSWSVLSDSSRYSMPRRNIPSGLSLTQFKALLSR